MPSRKNSQQPASGRSLQPVYTTANLSRPQQSTSYDAQQQQGLPSRMASIQQQQQLQQQQQFQQAQSRNAQAQARADYKNRLQDYQDTLGRTASNTSSSSHDPKEAELIQLLGLQMYHLPNHSWRDDWRQYFSNNHPIFGICFHHELHPIRAFARVVALLGSCVFGVLMTTMIELFLFWNPHFNKPVATMVLMNTNDDDEENEWVLTSGMLLLWTVGSVAHTMFNLLLWHLAACLCCRPGGFCESKACWTKMGQQLLTVFVLLITGMTVLIVLLKVAVANIEEDLNALDADAIGTSTMNNETKITETAAAELNEGDISGFNFFVDDAINQFHLEDPQEYEFLLGYVVELALSFFIYYPLVGTVLFSGMLGCGRVPMLGGRPAEVRAEEKRNQRLQAKQSRDGTAMTEMENVEITHAQHMMGRR